MPTCNPLNETAHRPWPAPDRPWVMTMTWRDLLFAHWPIEVAAMRAVVPKGLSVDTFEGSAWIGVVPFVMADVRPRGWPRNFPYKGAWQFPELNVRTYVTVDGKPGVYFFSLDAASRLAVRGARRCWGLNYFDARMMCQRHDDESITYHSTRTHRGAPPTELSVRYRPTGVVQRPAEPGSFEHFATERYCLYATDAGGRPVRGEIHHRPWPLQPAEATFDTLAVTGQVDLALPRTAPRLHFTAQLEVLAWLPQRTT